MRPMAILRRHDDISHPKLFLAVCILVGMGITVSAWDERDLAELRETTTARKENAARWLVEQTGQTGFYEAVKHCRAPGKGERLVMELAAPGEPGDGYRCTYWLRGHRGVTMGADVEYSRSPGVRLASRMRQP